MYKIQKENLNAYSYTCIKSIEFNKMHQYAHVSNESVCVGLCVFLYILISLIALCERHQLINGRSMQFKSENFTKTKFILYLYIDVHLTCANKRDIQ